jgi:hypothetical protein
MSSIIFGPQGYAQPPLEPHVPPAVQAEVALPYEPQATIEVPTAQAHDGSGTPKDDADRDDTGGRSHDKHGERRGKLLDIRG